MVNLSYPINAFYKYEKAIIRYKKLIMALLGDEPWLITLQLCT